MIRKQFDVSYPEGDPHLTIRQVVEWFKAHLNHGIDPNPEELDHMNKRWTFLVQQLAEQESVPVGWLSWAISTLVEAEFALLETAIAEGGSEIFGGSDDQPSGN